MMLRDVLRGLDYRIFGGNADLSVMSVTDDSRSVEDGCLFVAVKGSAKDGRLFIKDAVKFGARAIVSNEDYTATDGVARVIVGDPKKALAVIASNFYDNPSKYIKIIGITGTNGKTTITYLLESILKCAGIDSAVIGTVSHRLKGSVLPSKNTTPGILEIQSLLSRMRGDGSSACAVMEISSHALDQGRVEGVKFDAGVFTNVTSDHLDYHKTRPEYFKAKAKLFGHLKEAGVAILNSDDAAVASLASVINGKIITYGTNEGSDIKGGEIALSLDGSKFTVATPNGYIRIGTSLIGSHNVSNCLAAVAAAQAIGISNSAIICGIKNMISVPGRLEPINEGQPFKVFVDYAHTEDALGNILPVLRSNASGKIITVFGCGGDRDRSKRPLMGIVACRFSDKVIITSDNPRSEDPVKIIEDIESGIREGFSNYEVISDRKEAITGALERARSGDIVVIAGKGHEDYQIIKDHVLHFDDREVVREILIRLKAQSSKFKTIEPQSSKRKV